MSKGLACAWERLTRASRSCPQMLRPLRPFRHWSGQPRARAEAVGRSGVGI